MATGQHIAYYRVSSQKQGQSGLGLEAQKKAVADFLDGGDWNLVAEFTEVETGKNDKRVKLEEALKACKKHDATLVIAKLDRLSRNLTFISKMLDSKVRFVCADMPEANELTIQIMAVMAQHERKMISKRTKDALAAAKARGVKLGNDRADIQVMNEKVKQNANEWAEGLRDTLQAYKSSGMTQRKMVDALNSAGIKTRKGGEWSLIQVQRTLKRLELR